MHYDAVLLLSFGGPEGPADVMPFLENVLRGKNVPEERKLKVAQNYSMFGGVSPLNAQNRELRHLLEEELRKRSIQLPVFWGNRNWKPYLADTLREMSAKGVKRAVAYVTSAYSSYSGCRQYLEDIDRARAEVGPIAPQVEKLRGFFNHPKFIEIQVRNVRVALETFPRDQRAGAHVVFTAHSIPIAMAKTSQYEAQLREVVQLVSNALSLSNLRLLFQSRSGPPTMPWLEPDLLESIPALSSQGIQNLVIAPIGFVSDHMEVVYDLDVDARNLCKKAGIQMVRAKTPGNDPLFVSMIVDLLEERLGAKTERPTVGSLAPAPDVCPPDCCLFRH